MSRASSYGQLLILDAAQTLSFFMDGDLPDAEKFHQTLGATIAKVHVNYPRIRAYGEMVNLLWHEGKIEGAIQLEKLWNELARKYHFSLFCGYQVDVIDQSLIKNPSIRTVCCAHSHFISASGELQLVEN